ncbi:MAG: PD-(D/E)XK nuclease family protein [Casimicrobiaceae bacterium]
MSDASVTNAFAAGAVVVTPNNRLARHLADDFDRAQLAAARTTWPTPIALPWNAWLNTLWIDALSAGTWETPFTLLNTQQAARLWERAVDADALQLLDTRGAAERAASAWATFRAYAEPQESPQQFSGGGDDAAAFARWSRRFLRSAGELSAIDAAQLPERLIEASADSRFVAGRSIVLAGFVEFTPQQTRLVDALRAAGASIHVQQPERRATPCTRSQYRTPTDELVAALQWARERTLADAQARTTIAVVDLSSRLELVVQLADEVLRPQSIARAQLDGVRPYNVSLAAPLSAHALAVTAFDLLELAQRQLPLARAAALMRSPYLAGGIEAAAARAQHERAWRERNVTSVSLTVVIQELVDDDPLRKALIAASQELRRATARSPAAWADLLAATLRNCGWPGDMPQSSAAYQAYEALSRAFGEWRTLALVEPRLDATSALASLRAYCSRTPFQPQGAPVRIHVLGVLEAAGLDNDGLWLAGMDADAWPAPVVPEAFLPTAWQRARGVVHASAEHTLQRAQRLTTQLASSAREVVASHVASTETPPRSVSPLCDWPLVARPPQPTPTMHAIAMAGALEYLADARLPALPMASRIKGGVRVIELQSDCAFRAGASIRLHADAWPRAGIGLTAMERGNLVHAAMAAVWTSLGDQATLRALDDNALDSRVAAAVEIARRTIPEARWRALPAVSAAVEAPRLIELIVTFLRTHEAKRPPFRVVASEKLARLAIGGLDLGLRMDRVDALEDGVAVIDYKTGALPSVRQWLIERPVAPQLGLYVLALQQIDPATRVRAAALVSIKTGAFDVRGIADDAAGWNGLATPDVASGGGLRDFAALGNWWERCFGALAVAFRDGDAAVLPRERPNPCARCDFKPFCRIDLRALADGDDGDDDAAGVDPA